MEGVGGGEEGKERKGKKVPPRAVEARCQYRMEAERWDYLGEIRCGV